MLENQLITSISQTPAPLTALASYQEQVRGLLNYAEARTITCKEDSIGATNDLSMMANLKKALEERRKDYVKPLNDEVKTINNVFKTLTEPLDQADKLTRAKLLAYNAEQERLRQEAEAINQQKIELARREMVLKGEITVDTTPVVVPPEAPKHIRADAGMAGKSTIRKWEVEDFAQVPNEYKMVDAAKIGKVVRAGIPSIPGIRIWTEDTLRITPKQE